MSVSIGDKIRVIEGVSTSDFKAGMIGIVKALGVKYPGDVRVKFPHDSDLLWVYPEFYEMVESEAMQHTEEKVGAPN